MTFKDQSVIHLLTHSLNHLLSYMHPRRKRAATALQR